MLLQIVYIFKKGNRLQLSLPPLDRLLIYFLSAVIPFQPPSKPEKFYSENHIKIDLDKHEILNREHYVHTGETENLLFEIGKKTKQTNETIILIELLTTYHSLFKHFT